MSISVTTSFADSTAIQVSTTASSCMTIETLANPSNATVMFIQLFDSAAPTLGTDTPLVVVPIQTYAAGGARAKDKTIFANGGVRCTTGLAYFVTNAAAANTTAAAGTNAPQEVRVFWTTS